MNPGRVPLVLRDRRQGQLGHLSHGDFSIIDPTIISEQEQIINKQHLDFTPLAIYRLINQTSLSLSLYIYIYIFIYEIIVGEIIVKPPYCEPWARSSRPPGQATGSTWAPFTWGF